jgi:hypothetical protein
MRRTVALTLAIAIAFSGIAPLPAPPLQAQPAPTLSLPAAMARLNAGMGSVRGSFLGSDPRMIIHIQDAHANLEAARNMAKTIAHFARHAGIDTVAVEGSAGEIDPLALTSFPSASTRRGVADFFLREAKLNGAEYLAVTKRLPIRLFGVEDSGLYQANRSVFLKAIAHSQENARRLAALKLVLDFLAGEVLGEELRQLASWKKKIAENPRALADFIPWIARLAQARNVPLESYPRLARFLRALELDASLDRKKTARELTRLVRHFQARKDVHSALRLARLRAALDTRRSAARGKSDDLRRLVAATDLEAPAYRNALAYLELTELIEGIGVDLYEDLANLEGAIKTHLFRNQDERRIDLLMTVFETASHLFSFALTSREAGFFYSHRRLFLAEKIERSVSVLAEKRRLRGLPPMPDAWEIWDRELDQIQRFYELALKRDRILLKNTLAQMRRSGRKTAILVTGGFHTAGLTQEMRRQGISHVIIAPRITRHDARDAEESLYRATVARVPSALEAVLAQAKRPAGPRLEDPRHQLMAATLLPVRASAGEPPGVSPPFAALFASMMETVELFRGRDQKNLRAEWVRDWRVLRARRGEPASARELTSITRTLAADKSQTARRGEKPDDAVIVLGAEVPGRPGEGFVFLAARAERFPRSERRVFLVDDGAPQEWMRATMDTAEGTVEVRVYSLPSEGIRRIFGDEKRTRQEASLQPSQEGTRPLLELNSTGDFIDQALEGLRLDLASAAATRRETFQPVAYRVASVLLYAATRNYGHVVTRLRRDGSNPARALRKFLDAFHLYDDSHKRTAVPALRTERRAQALEAARAAIRELVLAWQETGFVQPADLEVLDAARSSGDRLGAEVSRLVALASSPQGSDSQRRYFDVLNQALGTPAASPASPAKRLAEPQSTSFPRAQKAASLGISEGREGKIPQEGDFPPRFPRRQPGLTPGRIMLAVATAGIAPLVQTLMNHWRNRRDSDNVRRLEETVRSVIARFRMAQLSTPGEIYRTLEEIRDAFHRTDHFQRLFAALDHIIRTKALNLPNGDERHFGTSKLRSPNQIHAEFSREDIPALTKLSDPERALLYRTLRDLGVFPRINDTVGDLWYGIHQMKDQAERAVGDPTEDFGMLLFRVAGKTSHDIAELIGERVESARGTVFHREADIRVMTDQPQNAGETPPIPVMSSQETQGSFSVSLDTLAKLFDEDPNLKQKNVAVYLMGGLGTRLNPIAPTMAFGKKGLLFWEQLLRQRFLYFDRGETGIWFLSEDAVKTLRQRPVTGLFGVEMLTDERDFDDPSLKALGTIAVEPASNHRDATGFAAADRMVTALEKPLSVKEILAHLIPWSKRILSLLTRKKVRLQANEADYHLSWEAARTVLEAFSVPAKTNGLPLFRAYALNWVEHFFSAATLPASVFYARSGEDTMGKTIPREDLEQIRLAAIRVAEKHGLGTLNVGGIYAHANTMEEYLDKIIRELRVNAKFRQLFGVEERSDGAIIGPNVIVEDPNDIKPGAIVINLPFGPPTIILKGSHIEGTVAGVVGKVHVPKNAAAYGIVELDPRTTVEVREGEVMTDYFANAPNKLEAKRFQVRVTLPSFVDVKHPVIRLNEPDTTIYDFEFLPRDADRYNLSLRKPRPVSPLEWNSKKWSLHKLQNGLDIPTMRLIRKDLAEIVNAVEQISDPDEKSAELHRRLQELREKFEELEIDKIVASSLGTKPAPVEESLRERGERLALALSYKDRELATSFAGLALTDASLRARVQALRKVLESTPEPSLPSIVISDRAALPQDPAQLAELVRKVHRLVIVTGPNETLEELERLKTTLPGLSAAERGRILLISAQADVPLLETVNETLSLFPAGRFHRAAVFSSREALGFLEQSVDAERQFEFVASDFVEAPWFVERIYDVILKLAETDLAQAEALIHKIGEGTVSFRREGNTYYFDLHLKALLNQILAEHEGEEEASHAA